MAVGILFMLKKKASWKLASGCLAAAIALAASIVFAVDATEIDTAETEQTTASQSTTEAQTAEYTMANYDASQTQKMSFVEKRTDNAGMALYNSKQAPAATTTTKTSASQTETSSASSSNTTSTTTVRMPYIYDGYVPSVYTTTTTPRIIPTTTTTTTRAATTTTRPVTTTTPKPVVTTTKPSQTPSVPGKVATPVITPERTYDTDYTHPYNRQTSQIKIHWNAVAGAKKYMVYVKNGQYSNWTNVATTIANECTVVGLRRDTMYSFAVKAVDANKNTSNLSAAVNIKTARMDYSAAGWQAMCRIVFHEVGGAAGAFWDKPIVYVADCVTNQYVCAKYTYQGVWPKYYGRFSNIESVIYTSGGFLSDAGLTARGASYYRVTERVKKAVWGATYGITSYNGIANDYNIFYWCNSSIARSDSRIGYGFTLPWGGYMYIWRQYWG